MDKKISILIANYNNGVFIEEAIASVYAQTYSNWEIVIVDDCSTDESIRIIEPYLADEKIKLYVNDRNKGCGFTKRRCLDEARGFYAGFLDPDDALFPQAIERLVHEFERYPDASLINSRDMFCDEALVPQQSGPYSKDVHDKGSYLLHEEGGVTHFAVFRMDLYRKTVGLSTEFTKAVDQDLYYLLDEVGTFYFVDEELYYYRIHKGGISTHDNVIPASYQHFKVKRKAAVRRLVNPKYREYNKELYVLIRKCDFHISLLDRDFKKIPVSTLKYLMGGGHREIFGMLGRFVRHPKRVYNSFTKKYRIK